MEFSRALSFLFAALICASQAANAGQFHSGSYGTPDGILRPPFSGIAPSREYWLYVPASYRRAAPLPLVVMLHGCRQSAESFAAGTRMNALAEEKHFLVLYPNQHANPYRCWNWFDGATQNKGGEAAIIVGMVRKIAAEHRVDTSRIYVAGLSAGGAMASNLASCYPEIFAAAAVHSGLEYKAAYLANATSALKTANTTPPDIAGHFAFECSGRKRLPMPVIVFHGANDDKVVPPHAMQVIRQFAQMNDYADDGEDNDSIKAVATSRLKKSPQGRHPYTIYSFRGSRRLLFQLILIKGMGHAWSGGMPVLEQDPYYDPLGPDASRLLWEFFTLHGRKVEE